MNLLRVYIIIGVFALSVFGVATDSIADDSKFLVVLDAGHGGEDFGAIGSSAASREKDINLAITLKVGELLQQHCPDIEVLYTRKSDHFVTLKGRADIANKAKADLFLSIHTNSVENRKTSQPIGVQSYTLTLRTAQENLEVEKRENSVLQFESDGNSKYSFANEESSESDIMFELMQDRDMQESVSFATLAQNEMVRTGGRKDMGVLQANLAVLRWTYMPSVLLEVGFICTNSEEQFLQSDAGRVIMAKCIFNAIATYKTRHTGRMSNLQTVDAAELRNAEAALAMPVPAPETTADKPTSESSVPQPEPESAKLKMQPGLMFCIQLFTSQSLLNSESSHLKGLPLQYYEENGTYKYTYGATNDYNEILRLRNTVIDKFPQCFIVAFNEGKHIDTYDAIQLWKNKK